VNLEQLVRWATETYTAEQMKQMPINEAVLEFKLAYRTSRLRAKQEGQQQEMRFEKEVRSDLN